MEMAEVEDPRPGSRELLVEVHATSVNPVDYKIREQGADFGMPLPAILGFDCSGVVREVGAEVEGFKEGDEVFYTSEILNAQGCNAEFNVVDESIVVAKPGNLSHEEAAAIPLAGGTAWQALVLRAGLQVGDTVLVHGAGGVGSMAVQIALAAGARVYATCSDYMVETLQSWGVERAINYKKEDFVAVIDEETEGEGVGIVFNTVGADLLTRSIPVTTPFGYLVGILDPEGTLEGAYQRNLAVELVFLQRERITMRALQRLAEREQLHPLIDSIVPLEEVPAAHERLEKGGVKGKIVVDVQGD